MAFNVKPFKEVLAYTKEKLDEALAPIRERSAKAKAELELAKLEEKMISQESEIHKLCAEKDLDFNRIAEKIDAFELTERRKRQITNIIAELFPQEK
jgi:hypothetical protein